MCMEFEKLWMLNWNGLIWMDSVIGLVLEMCMKCIKLVFDSYECGMIYGIEYNGLGNWTMLGLELFQKVSNEQSTNELR